MSMFRAIFWRLFFLLGLISFFLALILLYKKIKAPDNKNIIVAYGNYVLHKADLDGMSQDESNNYINDWLVAHYLEGEFKREADKCGKLEIEKKVLAYRLKLCAHMQLASLMAKKSTLEISDQEIDQFYKSNQKFFLLQDCLFKGMYIIIPRSLKENFAIKQLLDQEVKDIEALKKNCFVAKKYFIDDTVWLQWNANLEGTPYVSQNININNFCKKKLYIYYDKTYAYYLWITDLKKAGDVAPLSMVNEKVTQSLLFSKKIELEKQIISELLDRVKKDKKIKFYEE